MRKRAIILARAAGTKTLGWVRYVINQERRPNPLYEAMRGNAILSQGYALLVCASDLTCDGTVGPADLAVILGNWGPVPPNDPIADLNDDGAVGPADLAIVLGNWGACP